MAKIFISYRRDDAKHAVGRLYAALSRHVGHAKRDIFIDIDNIPKGIDFGEYLDAQVAQCDVLLAVIGPGWLNIKDPASGRRRLDDPNDFVRIEIASALKRGIPVVPVVLDETPLPAAADLSEDLKALSRRNGERLQHETFDVDVARLIRGLPDTRAPAAKKTFPPPAAVGGSTNWRVVLPVAGAMALAGLGLGTYLIDPLGWWGTEEVATPAEPEWENSVTSPLSSVSDASGTSQSPAPRRIDDLRFLRARTDIKLLEQALEM